MRNFIKFTCVMAVAIFAAVQAQAIPLGSDSFSYSDGDLPTVSGGAWVNFSGTTGVGDVQVISGQAQTSGARSGDDAFSFGGTHTNETIFACFDATVVAWAQSGAPAYFALLKDSSTFNFFARTYVTNVTGGVQFGITTGAAAPAPTVWSSTVGLGTTHRLTIELDQSGVFAGVNMAASLYMDGTFVGTASSIINSNYNITGFALRQSNATTMGTVNVDNLLVCTELGDCVIPVPEPSSMLLVGVGLVGLLVARRRRS